MSVGDKVSFVVIRRPGRSISCTVKEGVLVKHGEEYSEVKTKNGDVIVVRSNTIRIQGQKNALTEALSSTKTTEERTDAEN